MKKLIFPLIILSTSLAFAVDEMNELSDAELSKKLVTGVKEFEIQQTIGESAQFKTCKDQNPYKAGATQDEKDAAAKKAVECFQKQLQSKTDPKALGILADNLELQSYGLVNSKNTKEVTTYLADQMYEKLTGYKIKEQDERKQLEAMKFGKKKLIDQKVFIDLYKTQLIKNGLFEVNRFCLENFRHSGGNGTDTDTFASYWSNKPDGATYTDTGNKAIGNFSNLSDKKEIYANILEGFGTNDANKMGIIQNFFNTCSSQITPLCNGFKSSIDTTNPQASTGPKNGANACLTVAKLQKLRKAINNSKLVAQEFDKMNGSDFKLALDKMEKAPEFYDQSQNEDNSLDALTNYSSAEFLNEQNKDEKLKKKQDECAQNGAADGCDEFIIVDNSREKLEHDVDMNMRLKKEVELQRVKALNGQNLEEYLEANGYHDILAKYKEDPSKVDLTKEITAIFEARRIAELDQIRQKLSRRQMTNEEAKDKDLVQTNVQLNAQDSKEEKARLAQLVSFNNIVSSYVTLKKKGDEGEGKRNVSVIKKEVAGLESAQINQDLFENLKTNETGVSTKDGLFEDAAFIDGILGKDDKKN